jgi:MFS family permease
MNTFQKDRQYYKFCAYGFLKNLRFFEAFLILFFLESGLTFFQIGLLYSIREIARNIFEIPAGFISDSIGRKKTMVNSFSFYILSFLLYYFVSTFWLYAVAMLFMALGDAFRSGTHKAMIFDYLKLKGWADQKVAYYGHTRSFSQLGSAISALLAAGIVFFGNHYRIIFIFSVIPYILDLINLATYPAYLNGEIADRKQFSFKQNLSKILDEFIFTFKRQKVLRAIFNLSVYTGFYRSLKDYIQALIQALALTTPFLINFPDKKRTALLIGLIYFGLFLLNSFVSRRSNRFLQLFISQQAALNTTLIIGLILAFISSVFYVNGQLLPAVILFSGIYVFENLRKPIGISYVAENIPSKIMASVLSVESQVQSILAAILAPVIGLLADSMGLPYALLGVSVTLLILSPLVLLKKG